MVQGRGSAVIIPTALLVYLLLLDCDMTHAATYTADGWTFNVDGWPQGNSFKAGDVLVFNYVPGFHNVVAVNKAGYDTCKASLGAKVYNSGKDQIKLVKGQNFFLYSVTAHCQSNKKIVVTAV